MVWMNEEAREEWEHRYNASIEAEDKRQGRVRGKIDFADAWITFGMLLVPAAFVAVGIGILDSKVGVAYWIGVGVTLAAIASVAAVGIYRSRHDRRT